MDCNQYHRVAAMIRSHTDFLESAYMAAYMLHLAGIGPHPKRGLGYLQLTAEAKARCQQAVEAIM